jgi:hypothetical protein
VEGSVSSGLSKGSTSHPLHAPLPALRRRLEAAADRHRVASTATRLPRGYYEATTRATTRLLRGYTTRLLRGYYEATTRPLPGHYLIRVYRSLAYIGTRLRELEIIYGPDLRLRRDHIKYALCSGRCLNRFDDHLSTKKKSEAFLPLHPRPRWKPDFHIWSRLRGNGDHIPDPDLESFKTRLRYTLTTTRLLRGYHEATTRSRTRATRPAAQQRQHRSSAGAAHASNSEPAPTIRTPMERSRGGRSPHAEQAGQLRRPSTPHLLVQQDAAGVQPSLHSNLADEDEHASSEPAWAKWNMMELFMTDRHPAFKPAR